MASPVVHVAGWIYGGTTLLGRLLGEHPGMWFAGEIAHYWARMLEPDARCGCGVELAECPAWQQVAEATSQHDPARLNALGERVLLTRRAPLLAAALRGRGPLAADLREYAAALRDLYAAVGEVAGGRVVVDTSKEPPYGPLLRSIADVRTIQLVRDPRGSLHTRLERGRGLPPATVLGLWNATHVLAGLARPRLVLRYEDFAADPEAALARVASFLGLADGLPQPVDGAYDLAPSHTVEGNAMRFSSGRTEVRVDDEWLQALPRRHRALAVALTAPLLVRYRYPLAPRRGR